MAVSHCFLYMAYNDDLNKFFAKILDKFDLGVPYSMHDEAKKGFRGRGPTRS